MNPKEKFDAVRLGEGWVVLSPWIRARDGIPFRHHIADFGFGHNAEMDATHLEEELNIACRKIWSRDDCAG